MRSLSFAVVLLLGCGAQDAASPVARRIDPVAVVFATQCRFSQGSLAILSHEFGTDYYRLAVTRGGLTDVSMIRKGQRSPLEIETNGGIEKIAAVERLIAPLLAQSFRAVERGDLLNGIPQFETPTCPEPYPFSP